MSESKAKKIEIRDVDGQTLSKLIDYIYTAEIEVTEENVQVTLASGPVPHTLHLPFSPHSSSGVTKEKSKLQRIKPLNLRHMANQWASWP